MLNKINIIIFLATLLGIILLTPATKHFTEVAGGTPSLKTVKKRVYKRQPNVASRGEGIPVVEGFKVVTKLENVKMSHADLCEKCVGKGSKGYGKSGRKIQLGRSIAVDPNFIPLDSYVYIPQVGVVRADDTGSKVKGRKIDLYTELSHEENLKLGIKIVDIYVLEKE